MVVGVLDRPKNLAKKLEALVDREPPTVAVIVDRRSVNVLKCQEGLPIGADAGVLQPRDMRMLERRQNVSFSRKSRHEFTLKRACKR